MNTSIIKTEKKVPLSKLLTKVSSNYQKEHIVYNRNTNMFYSSKECNTFIENNSYWHFSTLAKETSKLAALLNARKFKPYKTITKFLKQEILITMIEKFSRH